MISQFFLIEFMFLLKKKKEVHPDNGDVHEALIASIIEKLGQRIRYSR